MFLGDGPTLARDFFGRMPKSPDLTAGEAAGFLTILISLPPSKDRSVLLNALQVSGPDVPESYVTEFLDELLLRAPDVLAVLAKYLVDDSDHWIRGFLMDRRHTIRKMVCELVQKAFPDPNEPGLTLLAKKLFDAMATLVSEIKSLLAPPTRASRPPDRMLPHQEYFSLLRWSLVESHSEQIFMSEPSVMLKHLTAIAKVDRDDGPVCFAALRFLSEAGDARFLAKKPHAKDFLALFQNITFNPSTAGASNEVIVLITRLLPTTFADLFFSAKFFKPCLLTVFLPTSQFAAEIEAFISQYAKPVDIAKTVWDSFIFSRNVSKSISYFNL
jgi:hypothetical protein